jgi:hypothetical protein
MRPVKSFVTLAASRSEHGSCCVAGIADDRSWLRFQCQDSIALLRGASGFVYFHRTSAQVSFPVTHDSQLEDRDIALPPATIEAIPEHQRIDFLENHLDESVESSFESARTLGLIRTSVQKIYLKVSRRDRPMIRIDFCDRAGRNYDWPSPEMFLNHDWEIRHQTDTSSEDFLDILTHSLKSSQTYFVVGLSKPRGSAKGPFRGCIPLIVGIHSFPDYRGSPYISNIP